jgi:hypothetical protein
MHFPTLSVVAVIVFHIPELGLKLNLICNFILLNSAMIINMTGNVNVYFTVHERQKLENEGRIFLKEQKLQNTSSNTTHSTYAF